MRKHKATTNICTRDSNSPRVFFCCPSSSLCAVFRCCQCVLLCALGLRHHPNKSENTHTHTHSHTHTGNRQFTDLLDTCSSAHDCRMVLDVRACTCAKGASPYSTYRTQITQIPNRIFATCHFCLGVRPCFARVDRVARVGRSSPSLSIVSIRFLLRECART